MTEPGAVSGEPVGITPDDDLNTGARIAEQFSGKMALWPERWPIRAIPDCDFNCPECPLQTACLIGKRREVGALVFDREYMCNPRSSVSSLFPLDMFEPMLNRNLQFSYNTTEWSQEVRNEFVIATGWDFALSEKVAADFTAKFTIAYHRETQKRQILEIRRWKGMTFEQQLMEIKNSYDRYQDDVVMLETVLFQRLYKNWVTEHMNLPVIGHNTGSEKSNLETGIPSLVLSMEQERYVIPYSEGFTREMTDIWLAECMAFGWVNDKLQGVGEHDDTVIAWWLAELAIKKTGRAQWGAAFVGLGDTVEI